MQIQKGIENTEDAIDIVMKEFVAENKFNLLPNSLLDVKELRQAKDNK
jgi:hypothetical protein